MTAKKLFAIFFLRKNGVAAERQESQIEMEAIQMRHRILRGYGLGLAGMTPCLGFFMFFSLCFADLSGAQVTVLVPSQPSVEQSLPQTAAIPKKNAENARVQGEDAPEPSSVPEIDILISMMRPYEYQGYPMDMPQLFAQLRHPPEQDNPPERKDLLGDVEEISYLGQKAWGVNVALDKPGLYQFILEGRPWWDEARKRYIQHQAKVILPVFGVGAGWEKPAGLNFEILPLSRPFGLIAPALFSGRILLNGKALADAPVEAIRINADGHVAANPWQKSLVARSDQNGNFSFMLNQPGWWCCMALWPGDPLKGPDGEQKQLERGTLFWLYVAPAPRQTPAK